MEFGLITFADMQPESLPGRGINGHQRLKDLMEEIKLADELGLDVFGIGEHHRPDYAVSSPAILLGAAAMVTKKIKLSSAVTVLSSDDPVRVFQNFSEVDLLSGGRAFFEKSVAGDGGEVVLLPGRRIFSRGGAAFFAPARFAAGTAVAGAGISPVP